MVTGGAGFIGSHLVERLADVGADVTVVDNLRTGRWDNLIAVAGAIRAMEADVRDAARIERIIAETKPAYLFHLAANPSVPGSVSDPVYDFETNCVGTFNVLNALRLTGGCEKVVVLSSGTVYGEPESFPIMETDSLKPISPYGASKLHAEVTAGMFHRVYGVPSVIARPFNVFGPRMGRFVVLDLLHKLHRNPERLEILGTGRQVRDFTYVADIVEGLIVLAERGVPCEGYNLSSGTACTITQLAQKLIGIVGLAGQTGLAFTGESWVGDAQRWEVALHKAAGLGYRPSFTLDEGLRCTIQWFEKTEGKICLPAH